MNFVILLFGFLGALTWELSELRADQLGQKRTRVNARKSIGFWIVVFVISSVVGALNGLILSGSGGLTLLEVSFAPPAKALVLASFFMGFGMIPALKSFKLLPIVNKIIGRISFEDTGVASSRTPFSAVWVWWAL